jgi:AAT family amino acid transporter
VADALGPRWGQPGTGTVAFITCSLIAWYLGFAHWGIGNEHAEHLEHAFPEGESLVWNFWWIIPLLWNEWFFHKWPFYVHEPVAHAAPAAIAAGR